MHVGRYPGQTLGTVPDRIHAGHHREQNLGRADVTGGLFSADVLLAGLQRQPQRRTARVIGRNTHDTAGERPGERGAGREKGRVGTAKPHRYTEPLRAAHGNVCAQSARAFQQYQGQ